MEGVIVFQPQKTLKRQFPAAEKTHFFWTPKDDSACRPSRVVWKTRFSAIANKLGFSPQSQITQARSRDLRDVSVENESVSMNGSDGDRAESKPRADPRRRYSADPTGSLVLSTDMTGVMMACSGVYYTDITVSFDFLSYLRHHQRLRLYSFSTLKLPFLVCLYCY